MVIMERVSASASRSLSNGDPRRYSYTLQQLQKDIDASKPPVSCNCPLPARPDRWSDLTWRKYVTAMARLPCKPCGWIGGVPARTLVMCSRPMSVSAAFSSAADADPSPRTKKGKAKAKAKAKSKTKTKSRTDPTIGKSQPQQDSWHQEPQKHRLLVASSTDAGMPAQEASR